MSQGHWFCFSRFFCFPKVAFLYFRLFLRSANFLAPQGRAEKGCLLPKWWKGQRNDGADEYWHTNTEY